MSNNITAVGTVATDPRTLTTHSGVALCTFRLASSERRYDREKNEWVDGETNWFTVTVFRGPALNARDSFRKGDRVIVHGRLRIRSWERDDRSGTSVDIEAESIGHELRWGVTRFTKRTANDSESAVPNDGNAAESERWAASTEAPSSGADAPSGALVAAETSTGEPSHDGFLPAAA